MSLPSPPPGSGSLDEQPLPPICSARGCRAAPGWLLEWSNPRIHGTDRRKTWLACEQHRESLAAFLDRRGFLRAVRPFDADTGTGAD